MLAYADCWVFDVGHRVSLRLVGMAARCLSPLALYLALFCTGDPINMPLSLTSVCVCLTPIWEIPTGIVWEMYQRSSRKWFVFIIYFNLMILGSILKIFKDRTAGLYLDTYSLSCIRFGMDGDDPTSTEVTFKLCKQSNLLLKIVAPPAVFSHGAPRGDGDKSP